MATAVALGCALLLVATSPGLPIVWDEGDTIFRADEIARLAELSGVDRHPPFLDAIRAEANWPYTTRREGHPPLSGILVALGSRLSPEWFGPLTAARFGPIVLFSLAVGAMFHRLQREYKVLGVSAMAVGALLTMPRLFAHAHFATLDGPLTACWILVWAAFAPACRDWRWIPCFGLTLGLTLSAKFTGWLAPLPFIVWTILYRDRGGLWALIAGVPLAICVFVVLNPPLWDHPLAGLQAFFDLNLHRAGRPELNISTQFFSRMYNLDHPLPWYNTLVWTAITITPVILYIGCIGIGRTLQHRRNDPAAVLVLCQWATLVIARALPIAPPHDAERLILPSFAFYAALIGIGIGRALYRRTLLLPDKIVAQGWAKVAMAIALAAATFDSISYYPHNLSYYGRLIGGLRGAAALGMEPTYYWDALDREALEWLSNHTAENEKAAFGAAPPKNLELLKRWGLLGRLPSDPGRFRWYVIQRRPSAWQPWDRWLIDRETPIFQRSFAGVPLLDIYSYEQYERAKAAAQ
ncbi:MAG: glycosyltransferase family 39 protein [Planctomycetia bacterium]|nr:glycosyltransferase family 39 protein [Planctomycetia bacterium]